VAGATASYLEIADAPGTEVGCRVGAFRDHSLFAEVSRPAMLAASIA
jgi:hypothetical protein